MKKSFFDIDFILTISDKEEQHFYLSSLQVLMKSEIIKISKTQGQILKIVVESAEKILSRL